MGVKTFCYDSDRNQFENPKFCKKLESDAVESLCDFDGLWCVPGSPYRSMNGALNAIRFARENNIPFIGTCSGFQHAVIEYAQQIGINGYTSRRI